MIFAVNEERKKVMYKFKTSRYLTQPYKNVEQVFKGIFVDLAMHRWVVPGLRNTDSSVSKFNEKCR